MFRRRTATHAHKWAHAAMKALFLVFICMSIASSVNWADALGHITGAFHSSSVPGVPSGDQTAKNNAAASAPGQVLKGEGYSPKFVIDSSDITSWLDSEQRDVAKVPNPGPYVVFGNGTTQFDTSTPPEVIVDATAQVTVGLYEAYTTGAWKGRGTACYTSRDARELSGVWQAINTVLQGKSLNQPVMLSKTDMPQLPSDVPCYLFKS